MGPGSDRKVRVGIEKGQGGQEFICEGVGYWALGESLRRCSRVVNATLCGGGVAVGSLGSVFCFRVSNET